MDANSRSLFTDFYLTNELPANNESEFNDLAKDKNRPFVLLPEGGSSFRAVDIPPHSESVCLYQFSASDVVLILILCNYMKPFHRTVTLDFGIVMKGTIVCKLDEGTRRLKEGDVIVQRGTIHAWINDSDEWCRMYFVMLGEYISANDESAFPHCSFKAAQKVNVNGKELDTEFR